MATVEKRSGKNGVSYRITVAAGIDTSRNQVRHRMTWRPEPGMTARQEQKALQRAIADFERNIELGYQIDNRQTFAQYAEYVLDLKARTGVKPLTIERYKSLLRRINAAIGHIKLVDLRPQHLNAFYKNLTEKGVRIDGSRALPKVDFGELLAERDTTKADFAAQAGVGASTISAICRGDRVNWDTAQKIAAAVQVPMESLFTIEKHDKPLSQKSILEHHRVIHTILAQAEKEMLVLYNAAAKAAPPKVERKIPNYFQPEQIRDILDALEDEPILYRTLTHLMIVTGCRRGELVGLKWEKVDMDTGRIKIDQALLYHPSTGVFESTTKTNDTRYLILPQETVAVLKTWRRHQLELRLMNGDRWQDTGYVFTRDTGEPIHPQTISGWQRDFSKRHNLPHINPHAFRHTVASVLLANGTDVVTVSKQLGHASVNTTESFYSHIIEENKSKAAECIADVMLRKAR